MPAPSSMADLSTTASSNYPAGSDSPSSLDDAIRALGAIVKQDASSGSNIASASTITIPNAGSYFAVTGTTGVTAINDSWVGRMVTLKFSGALTLTHSSGLLLPGAANIAIVAGDCITFVNESTGVWRCTDFQPVSGYGASTIASAATLDLSSASGTLTVSGTTTTTAITINAGQRVMLVAAAAWPLTYHATNCNISGGANYTCTAGDRLEVFKESSGTVRVNVVKQDGVASTAEAQAGTDNAKVITPLRLREAFNASGLAPVYACRAFVNFNGTGTVAIRASGNVSSITDNGTGDYAVNFTTALPDANYTVVTGLGSPVPATLINVNISAGAGDVTPTTSAFRVSTTLVGTDYRDQKYINLAVYR